jgi:hypothetical protein
MESAGRGLIGIRTAEDAGSTGSTALVRPGRSEWSPKRLFLDSATSYELPAEDQALAANQEEGFLSKGFTTRLYAAIAKAESQYRFATLQQELRSPQERLGLSLSFFFF